MRRALSLVTLGSLLFSCGHGIDSGSSAMGVSPVAGSTNQGSSQVGGAAAAGGGLGSGGTAASGGAAATGGVQATSQAGSSADTGGTQSAGGSSPMGGSNTQGGGSAAGGSQTDAGGATGISLQDVQAIFDARCIICHDASKVGLPSFPGLPLTAGASRSALVNQPASESCGGILVVPGDPTTSYLIQKLTSATPCAGAQMPRPYEIGRFTPLTSDQIDTISSWIDAGAPP